MGRYPTNKLIPERITPEGVAVVLLRWACCVSHALTVETTVEFFKDQHLPPLARFPVLLGGDGITLRFPDRKHPL